MIYKICQNKYVKYAIIVLSMLVYYIYIYMYISKNVPPNTDMSEWIIRAKDMVDGNIFQYGYLYTDVSHLFTDLPYYIIGAIIKGSTIEAYNISVSLMHCGLVFSGFLLVKDIIKKSTIKLKIIYTLIFAYICLFGNQFWIKATTQHSGGLVWAFIGLYFLNKYQITKNKKYIKYVFIFYALPCCGDTIALIVIIIPSIIVCLINLLNYRSKNLKIILVQILSIITGKFVDKLYCFLIPKTIVSRDGTSNFLDVNKYPVFVKRLLNATFLTYGSSINSECSIINLSFAIVKLSVIILTVRIVYVNLKKTMEKKEINLISLTATLGITLIYLIMIISNMFTCMYYSMYINSAPVLSAILIIRQFNQKQKRLCNFNFHNLIYYKSYFKLLYVFSITTLILLCLGNIFFSRPFNSDLKHFNEQVELAKILKDNDIKHIYSTNWWTSLDVKLISNIELNIIDIKSKLYDTKDNKNKYIPTTYFCCVPINKYNNETKFLVFNKNTPKNHYYVEYTISENLIKHCFGQPKKIIENESYKVFIYDYDLSTKLYKYDPYLSYFSKYKYRTQGCDFDK